MPQLETEFPVVCEAMHVIQPARQLVAASVRWVPVHGSLLGTFKRSEEDSYLDAVGAAVLSIVRAVPGGVLVFVPSYAKLARLRRRWMESGTWSDIAAQKEPFVEERSSRAAFALLLQDYMACVRMGRVAARAAADGGGVHAAAGAAAPAPPPQPGVPSSDVESAQEVDDALIASVSLEAAAGAGADAAAGGAGAGAILFAVFRGKGGHARARWCPVVCAPIARAACVRVRSQ